MYRSNQYDKSNKPLFTDLDYFYCTILTSVFAENLLSFNFPERNFVLNLSLTCIAFLLMISFSQIIADKLNDFAKNWTMKKVHFRKRRQNRKK